MLEHVLAHTGYSVCQYVCMSHQKIDRSDVSTSISTRESTIFVWKMMVFIILPSSLWSAIPRLALETLV